jgi:hypothetical protein
MYWPGKRGHLSVMGGQNYELNRIKLSRTPGLECEGSLGCSFRRAARELRLCILMMLAISAGFNAYLAKRELENTIHPFVNDCILDVD